MQITERTLWTLIHGIGFGGLYLLACSGALIELHRLTLSPTSPESTHGHDRFMRIYLIAMVVLAWAAVLSGTSRSAFAGNTIGREHFNIALLMNHTTRLAT